MTYLMDTYVNLPNFRSRESALTYALSNELLLSSSDYIDSTSFFFLSTGLPNQQELVPLLSQGLGNPQHECQLEYQQMVVLYLSIFFFHLFM